MQSLGTDIPTLVALLVCLIPTTIGALLAAIGIAGMDRALRANIIAKSGKAVEVAGDVDTLLLDKTGTITIGNRRATQFVPLGGVRRRRAWAGWPALASVADQTPEGKSIVELYRQHAAAAPRRPMPPPGARFVEFTAQTRMSGVDLPDGRASARGRPTPSSSYVAAAGRQRPRRLAGAGGRRRLAGGDAAAGRARATGSPAWSCWRTSSSRASASASSGCGRWACAPSWSPATTR